MARRIAYTGEPVLNLDDVAQQCRLDAEDMQALLIEQVIIPGVTQQAEALSGAAVREAEYQEHWPASYTSGRVLEIGQVKAIVSVCEVQADGSEQPLNVATRLVHSAKETRLLFPAGRPAGELSIRYLAGTDLDLHPGVRSWLLMHAATAYEHRETLVTGQILAKLPGTFLDSLLSEITLPARF